MALRQRSELYRRALELIPGGVNSPVRAMRAVGLDEPVFVAPRRGRRHRGRRRPPLRRLGDVVGAADLRARRPGDRRRRDRGGARAGTCFGAPTEARGRARRGDRRRGAVDREGAAGLLRDRGGDVGDPARARVHAPRPDPQVRRLLPRARRRAARRRRLRARDARHPVVARRADRRAAGHDRLPVQRRRRPPPPRSRSGARGSRRSSSSRSPGTWASSRPSPGFLEALRELCDASGALLVFDEVITGFRVGRGGAQERYGVRPDLTDPREDRRRRPAARGVRRAGRRDGPARAGRRRLPGGNALREPARDGGRALRAAPPARPGRVRAARGCGRPARARGSRRSAACSGSARC